MPAHLRNLSSVAQLDECFVKKNIEAAVAHYVTEVWIYPAHAALLDSTFTWGQRLLSLTQLDPSASGITTSKYRIRDRLDSIEINIAKMDVAYRPSQEKGTTQGTRHWGSFGTSQIASWRKAGQTRHGKGTFSGAADEVGRLADQIAEAKVGMVVGKVTPPGYGIEQVFTPHLYQWHPEFVIS